MKIYLICLLFFSSVFFASGENIFLGVSMEGLRVSEKKLDEIEFETGFFPSFVNLFLQWPKDTDRGFFPLSSATEVWERGSVLVVTWEPMYIENGEEKIVYFKNIISGKYDEYLFYVANEIKKYKNPLIIRFAHEMNLSRYHWGVEREEFNESYPALYRQTFRYVASFFLKEGIGNILWAFCPNCDSIPSTEWNKIKDYYPGDDVISILGVDGYNWGDQILGDYESHWRSFDSIFSSSFLELRSINNFKPLFVFETASVEIDGDRQNWINEALDSCKKNNITSLLWFHINKEQKWKISDSEKKIFIKYDQKKYPQRWVWEETCEKIRAFKVSR